MNRLCSHGEPNVINRVDFVMFRLILSLLCIHIIFSLNAQTSFYLFDQQSKQPILNAYVFFDSTNDHTLTDQQGKLTLQDVSNRAAILHISHLNYPLHGQPIAFLGDGDTIWMKPKAITIPTLSIVDKKTNKRKRWLKLFFQKFLGNNYKKLNVSIINSDELIFTETDGLLIAESSNPLIIHNPHLGYSITYFLQQFVHDANRLTKYHGKYFFESLTEQESHTNILQNRKDQYTNSIAHLLLAINNDTYQNTFQVNRARLTAQGKLDIIGIMDPNDFLVAQSADGPFILNTDGHLIEITHLTLSSEEFSQNKSELAGFGHEAEREMIQQDKNSELQSTKYEVSYLHSSSGKIIFDANGTILNSEQVKEYGYWGRQGLASVLPNEFNSITHDIRRQPLLSAQDFIQFFYSDHRKQLDFLKRARSSWNDDHLVYLLEILTLHTDERIEREIVELLQDKMKTKLGNHAFDWWPELWTHPATFTSDYFNFKAEIYRHIDPKFEAYFKNRSDQSTIRMDEVVWGGVVQDGIPPLIHPKMLSAAQAHYLDSSDQIFGMVINGEASAYPQRILGWHEMVTDSIGGRLIHGVYCTLCGTMVAYDGEVGGQKIQLGTSGFLYQSNKLMYDYETQSLWSTIEGKPVVGPLTTTDIQLEMHPVIHTTWRNWKSQYPNTKVLSLATGYNRDYAAGAAYKKYYSTDRLFYPVLKSNNALANKETVFVIRSPDFLRNPLAITRKYLKNHSLFQHRSVTFISDVNGGCSAYATGDTEFTSRVRNQLKDENDNEWEVNADFIANPKTKVRYYRLPGHEIFWFAWFNSYPSTELIK